MAIPVLWRTKHERYSLRGDVCPECEQLVFPPRQLCPYCGREAEQQARAAQEAQQRRRQFVFMLPHAVEMAMGGDD